MRIPLSLAAVALPGLLLISSQAGAKIKIEHLGQPCRALSPMASCMVTDRADGRERLAFANANEAGVELVFLDFEGGKSQVFKSPVKSNGGWSLIEVPNDRLVMATSGGFRGAAELLVFDLKKMGFLKAIPCGGDMCAWNLAIGGDGRVYVGTYSSAKLLALDLDSYELEDLGAHGSPNIYLRYVSALPDGRLLCRYLFEKPTSLIFDPATKKFEPAPEHLKDIERGVSWHGYFLTLGSLVCDGKTLAQVTPPFPVPDKGYWRFEPALIGEDAVFFRWGNGYHRWSPGDKDVTLFAEADLRGGNVMARTQDGSVIGIRGQDYFILKQGDRSLNLHPIPGETSPRPTFFLRVDDQGRVWGGSPYGQTVFWLDPKTRQVHNTRAVNWHGGEVYDAAFHGGKPHFVAYTSGAIIQYDPDQPWDEYNDKNPKVLAAAGPKGYIRPEAGISVGSDGRFYSGLMAKYGTYGGAVLVFDPVTGASELIENPLGDQGISSLVVGEGVIFVGTNCRGNGLPSRYDVPTKLGIIDLATKKTIFETEPGGCGTVRALGYDVKSKRLVVAVGKALRLFDAKDRKFLWDACEDAPELTCGSVGWAGAKLYYGSARSVVCLDVTTGKAATIVEAPAEVSHVAVGPDTAIYFACDIDLYVVRE